MGYPHEDLAAHIETLSVVVDNEVSVVTRWPSTVDMPAVVIHPVRRTHVPVCQVEWELAVDVAVALTGNQALVDDITEAINTQPLKHYVVGDTEYRQASVGGADCVIASTTVRHTR